MVANLPPEAIRVQQAEVNRMCVHQISLAPFAGRNSFGDDSWGAPVTHNCYVVAKQRSVVNAAGEQQGSKGSALLAFNDDGTAPTVSDDDKLTLPSGETPVIVAVERDPGNPAISPTILFY